MVSVDVHSFLLKQKQDGKYGVNLLTRATTEGKRPGTAQSPSARNVFGRDGATADIFHRRHRYQSYTASYLSQTGQVCLWGNFCFVFYFSWKEIWADRPEKGSLTRHFWWQVSFTCSLRLTVDSTGDSHWICDGSTQVEQPKATLSHFYLWVVIIEATLHESERLSTRCDGLQPQPHPWWHLV